MGNLLEKLVIPDNASEAVKSLADMRWMSNNTGVVYQEQVEQLQKLAAVVFDDIVTISINRDTMFLYVDVPHGPTKATSVWDPMVKEVLGVNWTSELRHFDGKKKNAAPKNRKPRPAKRRGKKRPRSVQRK